MTRSWSKGDRVLMYGGIPRDGNFGKPAIVEEVRGDEVRVVWLEKGPNVFAPRAKLTRVSCWCDPRQLVEREPIENEEYLLSLDEVAPLKDDEMVEWEGDDANDGND